jgi:acetyl-CoA acetyltransferase
MENMDRAPYLMSSGRWGHRMGDGQIFDAMLMDGLNDAFSGQHSGWHAEDLAQSHQITRDEQDHWVERSQKRFAAAQSGGKFVAEIVGVDIPSRKGPVKFDKDEHNRPDTTMESLSKLKPAFRKEGTITAGNAPGLNTGGCGHDRSGARLVRKERPAADWAPGFLWGRRRRAGHVRPRPRPGRAPGARTCRGMCPQVFS